LLIRFEVSPREKSLALATCIIANDSGLMVHLLLKTSM